MFVKHCERQEFNSSHLKLDVSLYFQLGTFPTSWECSLHTKAAHLRTNPLLRKAASFPGAPADCISSAAVLETHLDITVNISAGRKQSKQNSSLSAVRQGLDAFIYLYCSGFVMQETGKRYQRGTWERKVMHPFSWIYC